MDPITQRLMMGASGSGGPKTYIEDVFSTWLYTGNSSTQTITNGIDLSGKGGLVWLKKRSAVGFHWLHDTQRIDGSGIPYYLSSNDTAAQGSVPDGLTAFTSSGFTLGGRTNWNDSGATFASWTFRKAAKFFDVVTYTGNGSTQNVAHSLGSVPGCMIVKAASGTTGWYVYHRSLVTPSTDNLVLNETGAADTGRATWNNTAPTSTQFSVSASATGVNANGVTYVAYLFAHDAGGFGDSGNDSVVKCGSYTGNGSATGPTIDLGWEPQWLLIKRATVSTGDWLLFDNMRLFADTASGDSAEALRANSTSTDAASRWLRPLNTGFQPLTTATSINASGSDYIYIAIRRGPMKTPTDATKVFSAITASSDTTGGTTNFPVDWLWMLPRAGGAHRYVFSRLAGAANYLKTSSTDLENTGGSLSLASNTSFTGPNLGLSGTIGYEAFRRAPGFFDVVTYTGTNAVLNVSHNLGVVPEMMICRQRGTLSPRNWWVYHSGIGNTKYLVLNTTAATVTLTDAWNDTTPTSSVFTLGSSSTVNQTSQPQIAYLFASCPGVSKVGSYTGTGTTLSIDCGFTNGARFVLIKRTDSTGDWYVWDTARGIVSGNDPYLLLNSTAAEVTSTDYIDPLSSGFQISSTAPAAINANGGSYIFLAIA
jgi:hypothetical protein